MPDVQDDGDSINPESKCHLQVTQVQTTERMHEALELPQEMTITVTFFDSVPELKKHVEQTIADTKTSLGVTLQKTEEVRKRYEVVRKHFESLRKTSGKKDVQKDTRQMEIANFKILINPSADYELTLMEESVSSLQEKIDSYEKTKELFPSLADNQKIAMVLNEGIPAGFMLYVPNN